MSSSDAIKVEKEKFQEKSESRYTQTLIQCKPKVSDKDFINMLEEKIAQDVKATHEENALRNTMEENAVPKTQS